MNSGNIESRARQRAVLFSHIAERTQKEFPAIVRETEFRADAPILTAWAYFLISDAYKSERIPETSLSDDFKKAAISALAIMVVRPFSPLDPDNVNSMDALLANPIFALAAGNSWLGDRNLFDHFGFDYLKRFFNTLLNVQMPSLAPFIEAINENGDYRQFIEIGLSKGELALVDSWVLKFNLLATSSR